MDTSRKNAIVVGVLFIIATVMLFVGGAFYEPILESPDYLDNAYPNRIIGIIGILLEFTKVPAIALIPVFLFSTLKRHNEALALGYVSFRFLEAVLLVGIEINKLSLINISRDYLAGGGMDASYFRSIGNWVQSVNDWTFSIYLIIFTLGALVLYYSLYKSNLIPRFISAWGFLAAVLLLTGSLLTMVDVFAGIPEWGLELVFALPIAVNEMVLAIWLVVKGFDRKAITALF